ncbi:Stk1 family PASTA domain-containing Ser/Thr kinase [Terrabacter sp. Soil810]|uniref:Stk1 family PASTA domain-containing Ser/Thr kinase n=1 Tax=Terrabacter sp. Soil810 TaxID=1736418 RepID=UPI000709C949|nr:Stk1 family PASTA domain-containing Ser/Thr kinase [Terrabacter sp. Soil810]KRF38244.1 serine/threonine protein kinase [Terrabacter sp. Soil810]
MSTAPRVLGGRYEVGELIGRGGMADVHLGHDTRLGRQVAIKMLRSDLARDANFLMRFRREAQSAAGLNHPAIVAIFDSGEDDSVVEGPNGTRTTLPYIVMEYVDGETLRQQLTDQQQLQPAEAIRVTEGILDALAYSHRMGIVHRDIKPANVMITTGGHVKVMDFGIARAIADTAATMTQTQSVVGTAQYLSPEQAQGQTVDERSDLYSTGCLLFELLAGRPPFTGDSAVAIAYQHVGELPQPPSVFNDAVAGDLDAVTLHALAKDREARYQDATAFRDDLENVRLGRRISAAALGTAAAVGAAATQTLPQAYAAPGTPTAVQAPVTSRSERYANTAGLPAVGHDEQDADDRKGGTGKAVLITGLVIALLALVGWGGVKWFGNQTPDVTLVSVPTIEGMKEDVAARTLATNNLRGEKSTAASTTVTEGDVISQDPRSGTRIAELSVVQYVVSTGPDNLTVPDVTGFNKDDARAELEKQGFVVSGFQEENTPDQDKNKVTKTEPAAQAVVPKGSKIKIFYATGNVKVPDNLVGKDWALAAVALQNAGLNPVKQTVDSDKNPDEVLSVDRSGDVVKLGTDITVKVARTPSQTATVTITPPPPPTDTTTDTGTSPPPTP